MDGYPINPVVSGLSKAVQAAQAIQWMALQREAVERAVQREKREEALQELDLEHRLLTGGAKPVEAGTYEQTIRTPEGGFMQTRPPVDRGRTLRAKLGGREREYYIPTAQERQTEELASKLEEIRQLGDVQRQLEVARAQSLLPVQREAAQVEVPGFGTVHQAAIPVLTSRVSAAAAAERQRQQQRFQAQQGREQRQTQVRIAEIQRSGRNLTSENQRRLARRDELNEFDEMVASQAVQRAGTEADAKAIREALDQLMAQDRTGQVRMRYLSILKKAQAGAVKPKTMGQMTPAEFAAEMEKWAAGEGGSATAPKPETPKPKGGTAAELIAEIEAKKRRAQKR